VTHSRRGSAVADTSWVKTRLLAAVALLAALMVPFLGSPAQAAANDYPYRNDTTNASGPWGFTQRQCVSFVAWRLHQRSRDLSNRGHAWGNAAQWDETAKAKHFAHERSKYYAPNGATGYLEASQYGHVAYVTHVWADGSVTIEQCNISGNRAYSSMHVKANRYLYLQG
jgi:surface antigen